LLSPDPGIFLWDPVLWSRSQSRGAENKLPSGTGAEITKSGSGSFIFTTDLKRFYGNKKWFLKNILQIVLSLILILESK
jgi:hypothetical protein